MNKLPIFEKFSYSKSSLRKRASGDGSFSFFSFIFLIVIVFVVFVFRLFQLTVVKGEYYRRLADENRVRNVVIEAPRGKILDRKGVEIAVSSNPDLNQSADRINSKRTYTSPEAVSSLIGYRQTADQQDIDNDNCLNKLKIGDKVGKKGIEKLYECDLHGVSGKKLIELDAQSKYVRTLSIVPPQPGKIIKLSLDLNLQNKAYEQLNPPTGGKKGAIIALKPKTGEVLAFVSSPGFNPQDFEDNNQNAINKYLNDKDNPLFDRVAEGAYPPGSIFKLVLATGVLEEKIIDENTLLVDNGILKAGPLTFGNWYFLQYGKTEGELNIVKAIRRSTDTFFYQVGDKLGPEKIKYWADRFGYGKKINMGLEQAEGTVPSPFWKKEILKENWYLGDTYNLSIGQGYLLVTPLQVGLVTSVFANAGNLCLPKFLKDEKPQCKSLNLSEKTLALVREGMKGACSTGGTGWPLFDFEVNGGKIQTACKTGTAESQDKSQAAHAWITAFAPFDNPEIAVTVLVENGGQGSDVAGPIAKEIFKTYFENNH